MGTQQFEVFLIGSCKKDWCDVVYNLFSVNQLNKTLSFTILYLFSKGIMPESPKQFYKMKNNEVQFYSCWEPELNQE